MSDIPSTPADPEIPEPSKTRPQEYVADVGFDALALSEPVRRALAERGYTHPTPVQAKAFAPVVAGRDLIVRSKTGTGKTAAFGLPLLEKIPPTDRQVRALIMCPTRELALQVAAEIEDLGKYKGVKVAAIYGGASMKQQEDALTSGTPIIVGTPGRIFDHIRRGNLKLDGCRHVVLDEADEMLNQGFYEEVTRILDYLPKDRQVLLFSATVPDDIQRLINRYLKDPETLLLSGDVYTVEHIHHVRYDVSDNYPKPRNLIYILEIEQPENAIVFCNTKDDTSLVTAVLNRNGFDAELLNGDLPQKERERVMAKVKRGEVAFMVATDIAARGIDISDLGHVINYSLPEDPAVYLHRVGRTGRIGKKGTAINLVSGRELGTFTTLERKFNITFEKKLMPSPDEALKLWTERHVREIKEASGGAVYEAYLALAGQLKTRGDSDDLIAFLLKSFFTHLRQEKAQASEDSDRARGFAVKEARPLETKPREKREGRDGGRRERSERGPRPDRGERREKREGSSAPHARIDTPTSEVDSESPATTPAAGPAGSSPGDARPASDRPPRRERAPRPASTPVPEGQARLWVNLGKSDNVNDDAGLRSALEAAGAPAGKILHTELRGTYAYAFVADADVGTFEALSGKQHGEKAIKIEKAKR